MGTLATELGRFAGRLFPEPRIYADANIPVGAVSFMRARLKWDVLYVVEHDDLRRASDGQHYRTARRLRRTIVTLDRDFADDRRFPPDESGGVIICEATDERALHRLLRLVRVAGAGIDLQVLHLAPAEGSARNHALDRLLDDPLGMAAFQDLAH